MSKPEINKIYAMAAEIAGQRRGRTAVLRWSGLALAGVASAFIGAGIGYWLSERRTATPPDPVTAEVSQQIAQAALKAPAAAGVAEFDIDRFANLNPAAGPIAGPVVEPVLAAAAAINEPTPAVLRPPTPSAVLPAWQRFAVAPPVRGERRPMIALVIDDMGVARGWSQRAVTLPAPLTMAYLPYADELPAQTAAARAAGHELLLHIPMEPDDATANTGPNALFTYLDPQETMRRLDWSFSRFGAYVGVNNHMGSRYSRDAKAMRFVLDEIKARGLLFLDSVTTSGALGHELAREAGIPATRRDVFIDDDPDPEAIARQLLEIEITARKHGQAVGIGHPRPATLDALEAWIPEIRRRGFVLVPISTIVARSAGVDLVTARAGAAGREGAQ